MATGLDVWVIGQQDPGPDVSVRTGSLWITPAGPHQLASSYFNGTGSSCVHSSWKVLTNAIAPEKKNSI